MFFLLLNLKEQQKSGRSSFTVSFFVFINFLFSNAIITKQKLEIHIWKNITLLNIYTS